MSNSRMSAPAFRGTKGKRRLVCLTAYDVLTAEILDEAGVDLLLVGDSLANVVLGHETTLPVTLEDVLAHAQAVMRAKPKALVIADMPFLSYHITPEETLRNAGRLIKEGGVDGVKLEGGESRTLHIRALIDAEIPVMGHLGLTPQSVLEFGGYRVQGRSPDAAERLAADAEALERAGCFAMVLEGMPSSVAERITASSGIPTIGIGAGASCDGQILVTPDLIGLTERAPKFVRRYADVRGTILEAARRYTADVRDGTFPASEETYDG